MVRKNFVGGNWKCNGSISAYSTLIDAFNSHTFKGLSATDVIIAPPACYLSFVKGYLRQDFSVSAENCIVKSGAFTGEMSVAMVKDLGLRYTILGHSERRNVFGESDKLIAAKLNAAQTAGLNVIFCCGEHLKDRKSGNMFKIVGDQLSSILKSVVNWNDIVIAYEPIWAIGTGEVASPTQAQEMHAFIRKWLDKHVSSNVAKQTRIIYGGSVKAKNCESIFAQTDVDGFLVGGAALKPEFIKIIESTLITSKL